MTRSMLLAMLLFMPRFAAAQPACNPTVPNALQCQSEAVAPQPNDILFATQVSGPQRPGQTTWIRLSTLIGLDHSASPVTAAGVTQSLAAWAAEIPAVTAAVGTEQSRAEAAEALLATLLSPALAGTPTAPTATPGTNTTQLATTAFVATAVGGAGWLSWPLTAPGTITAGAAVTDNSTGLYGILFAGTKTGSTAADLASVSNSKYGFYNTGGKSYLFWDNSATSYEFFTLGTHLVAWSDKSMDTYFFKLSGSYIVAAFDLSAASTSHALNLAAGQDVCFTSFDHCLSYASSKLTYKVGGTAVFSVSDSGAATFAGTVTPSGTP